MSAALHQQHARGTQGHEMADSSPTAKLILEVFLLQTKLQEKLNRGQSQQEKRRKNGIRDIYYKMDYKGTIQSYPKHS